MNGEEIDLSYEFGPFRLEPSTRRLLREGEALPMALAALAVLLLPLAGYLAGRRATTGPAPPRLTRLTFRRGIVRSARFAPDGRTVVYSALWDTATSITTTAGSPISIS